MTDISNEDQSDTDSLQFVLTADDAGIRLDAFLSEKINDWSRSRLQRLITDGDVLINGKPAKSSYKLRNGDEIDVELTESDTAVFEPENIPLDIVFEDEHLAVINKPSGMVVHPGSGISSGTLANALAHHFQIADEDLNMAENSVQESIQNIKTRVGIVHRLDKYTSGLILVAKNEEMHDKLSELFRRRSIFKSYVALVHGSPRENGGTIDRPIARDRWHRTKMTVAANGRNALSIWKVRQRFEKFSLVEVEIKTGRTHQIRVHLASINHPVVGDEIYNEGRDNTIASNDIKQAVQKLGRFFLHAERLEFVHPVTGKEMKLKSGLPQELSEMIKAL